MGSCRPWSHKIKNSFLRYQFLIITAGITFIIFQFALNWTLINRLDDIHATPTRSIKIFPTKAIDFEKELSLIIDDTVLQNEKRAFVCITGQLGRLELENKVNTIFKPMLDGGYELDLHFILGTGAMKFTQLAVKKDHPAVHSNIFSAFNNEDEIKQFLERYSIYNVNINSLEQMESPPINSDYLLAVLKDYHNKDRENLEVINRIIGNARMFETYRHCWDGAVHRGEEYSVHLRIREDVGLEKKIKLEIIDNIGKNKVITSDCRTWNGMNDRFAIVSPNIAQIYYQSPYQKQIDGSALTSVRNSETYFKYIYSSSGIKVVSTKLLRGVRKLYINAKGESKFYEEEPICPMDGK